MGRRVTYSAREIFLTVQGEGGQSGRAAVFLRFAGCNLWSGREQDRASAVCNFCDTDFVGTDGDGGGKFRSADDLADAVAASGAAQVFLCGPHMQALWHRLAPEQRGVHRADSAALAGDLPAVLRAGDVVAVKGSLGSKMKIVVDAILAASGGEAGR